MLALKDNNIYNSASLNEDVSDDRRTSGFKQ